MKARKAEGCDAADAPAVVVDEMVVGWGTETGRIGGAVADAIVVDQGRLDRREILGMGGIGEDLKGVCEIEKLG